MKRITILFSLLLTACVGSSNFTSIPQLKFDGMKGNISMVKESKYDAKEKFGEIVPSDLDEVTVQEYNKDGRRVSFAVYDEDGKIIFKLEDEYEKGHIVSETTYQSYGDKKTVMKVVERKKNYVKWVEVGADKELVREQIFDGYTCKQVVAGETVSIAYFDKKGRFVEEKSYHEGDITFRILQEYDDKNNPIKTTEYRSYGDPVVQTFTYPEFDKKGNWITQFVWEDGEVINVVKREITYR